ncbi:GNAT family N-acetyltransferase [Dactylosporangium cerinum]
MRLTALGEDGGPTGVVFGSISDADPLLGHVELIAVRPDRRREGIGRELLAAAERELAARGAQRIRIGGNPPCYVWPGIDVRYTPAVCLAQRAGYERTNTAWNMTADLTGGWTGAEADEERLDGAGVKVMRAGPDTPEWVRGIWGNGWAWEVAQSLDRDGAGCWVAVKWLGSGGRLGGDGGGGCDGGQGVDEAGARGVCGAAGEPEASTGWVVRSRSWRVCSMWPMRAGLAAHMRATTPATWGVAMEVPLRAP